MKKLVVLLLAIIIMVLLFSACTAPEAKNDLSITQMISSIGGGTDNFADQHYSYTIYLRNDGQTEVTVNSIEPVLSSSFSAKAKGNDFKVNVNKTIAPEAYIEISGEIQFDAAGLTKEQIVAMEPFFNSVKINTDKLLPMVQINRQ